MQFNSEPLARIHSSDVLVYCTAILVGNGLVADWIEGLETGRFRELMPISRSHHTKDSFLREFEQGKQQHCVLCIFLPPAQPSDHD